MLKNISYNDSKVFDEINNYVGKPYTIFQRLRIGGIGSSKLIINKADSKISNLLNLDNNINKCNIEIRPKGIIIRFRSLLETYGLIIPYYKLVVFKVSENEYTFNVDSKFVKIKIKSEKDHTFIRKIMEEKARYTKNYTP